jgi:hypothetical protein
MTTMPTLGIAAPSRRRFIASVGALILLIDGTHASAQEVVEPLTFQEVIQTPEKTVAE